MTPCVQPLLSAAAVLLLVPQAALHLGLPPDKPYVLQLPTMHPPKTKCPAPGHNPAGVQVGPSMERPQLVLWGAIACVLGVPEVAHVHMHKQGSCAGLLLCTSPSNNNLVQCCCLLYVLVCCRGVLLEA